MTQRLLGAALESTAGGISEMVRRQGWLVYVSFLFEQHSPCVREYILRIPGIQGCLKIYAFVRYPTTTNVVSCFPWIFTEGGHSSNTFPLHQPPTVLTLG